MGLDDLRELCVLADEQRAQRAVKYKETPTRYEKYLAKTNMSVLAHGHSVMDKIRMYLKRFDTKKKFRGSNQILMQEKMLGAICALVYGPDVARKYELEIKQYNSLKSLKKRVFYSAPRRGGKSEGLGQYGAALGMVKDDLEMCIFSIAKRSAGKESGLLGNIANKMRQLGLKETEIIKDTEEHFYVLIDGNLRKFHGYPGAVHTYVSCMMCMMSFILEYRYVVFLCIVILIRGYIILVRGYI
jgi:hypothetical protein